MFDELRNVEAAHAAVPIKQTSGLFHASAAVFEPIDKIRQGFIAGLRETHSIDPDLIKKNKHGQLHKKFDTSLTNVMNSYAAFAAPEITWYAEGAADEAERLLRPIQFIGKRRASGFGEVSEWTFDDGELDDDEGLRAFDPGGVLRRRERCGLADSDRDAVGPLVGGAELGGPVAGR